MFCNYNCAAVGFCRTEIEWYPGKCLTQKILKKKPKKGSKNAKPITKTEDCESFFNFFNPPLVPEDVEEIDEDTVCIFYQFFFLFLFSLQNVLSSS
jgi:Nucleosome assembly protein (NAP)